MARKISFLILAVAILITGIIAFRKLNYWERSIRIFRYDSGEFEGSRGGNGERGGFSRQGFREREFSRSDLSQLPDSIRSRFEGREEFSQGRERSLRDSLRYQFRRVDREVPERGSFSEGFRNRGRSGRDEFQEGGKVNLRNVKWFLAVFAGLTVLAIYAEKGFSLVCKRKKQKSC